MSEQERCPKCGAEVSYISSRYRCRDFDCESTWTDGYDIEQSDICRIRELQQRLTAAVDALRELYNFCGAPSKHREQKRWGAPAIVKAAEILRREEM
jgi:hypothetical protein